ncbi:MAG TPA: polymer-forming cytoskeletal protein, partial [Rubrivivax sp.]|nr:polymer-forming cytoskeletal protein [Rubrivivax sp.]
MMAAAAAAQEPSAEGAYGGDRFVAGGSLTIDEPVAGDLIAAGGSIDIDAPVGGDAVLAGGRARLGADVAQSVYAAGGQLTVAGRVGRNLRAAGGRVELGPQSQVAGNATVAGGQVTLRGRIGGDVQIGGGQVLIDGPVAGNVSVGAGQLELGPRARIEGRLRLRSGDEPTLSPQAQVLGGIERLEMPAPDGRSGWPDGYGGGGWLWTIGLMLLAAVLLGLMPRAFGAVAQALQAQPALSVGLGFVVLVATPAAVLVLLVTLIGAPLALLLLAAYLALLPVGYASAGIGLGDWALRRWRAADGVALRWRVAAAAAAVLALSLLGRIPFVGG